MIMEYTALAILWLSVAVGFIAVFFGAGGTLIIFLGCVAYAWMTGFIVLTFRDLAVLLILYATGEVGEYLFTFWGAKTFGGSSKAALGAMIGGFAGAVVGSFLLGLGIVLGTFAGIFLGAFLAARSEKKNLQQSFQAGTGGVVGRIGSIIAKVIVACVMIGVIIFALK